MSKGREGMEGMFRGVGRSAFGGLAALLLIQLLLGTGASMAAAAPAPAWGLRTTATPTQWRSNYGAGGDIEAPPSLHLAVENVGGQAMSGPFVLRDELPLGVSVRERTINENTPDEEQVPLIEPRWITGASGPRSNVHPARCDVAGRVVTCEGPSEFPAGQPLDLKPGEGFQVRIYLETGDLMDSSITNVATITGGGAPEESDELSIPIDPTPLSFGFLPDRLGASLSLLSNDGSGEAPAGSHPDQVKLDMGFPLNELDNTSGYIGVPGEGPKELRATLPQGMIFNPNAVPVKCTEAELETETSVRVGSALVSACPLASQVGTIAVATLPGKAMGEEKVPLYNMVAPGGTAALLGFQAVAPGIYIHIVGGVNSAGEYELTARGSDISNKFPVNGLTVTLWGDPLSSEHDPVRGECAYVGPTGFCSVAGPRKPQLSLPSACADSMEAEFSGASWADPSTVVNRRFPVTDRHGAVLPVTGCGSLDFDPSISVVPTATATDSPTGLDFNLHVPQNESLDEPATANLRDAKVALPSGVSLNPSAANGLEACTESQIGVTSTTPLRFSETPQTCPNAAKIGTVEVSTPLLDHRLPGSIYVAKPGANPFGSLLAIYLAVEDERSGVISKLGGRVEADPQTGQLTTTFTENPELPLEDVRLRLFGSSRSPLKSGLSCGRFETTSRLTSWAAPSGPAATPSDSFQIGETPSGAPCPGNEGEAPAEARMVAGTVTPTAAAYSPLVFSVSRDDGSQQMSAIEAILPPGLIGRLAGIPYCPEAGIARAVSRSEREQGRLEVDDPSCPSASAVGTVDVSAGAGSPVSVRGRAYLAGPYKGAPVSLEIITPAIAGPFDLGVVAVRVALQVDPLTTQIRAVSDPLPRILHGIPLDVRRVLLRMDRPGFTLNPSSCDQMTIGGALTTFSGAVETLAQRFQVGGCGRLGFKPKLSISLKGSTKRTGKPALRAVVTFPQKGEFANIASAQVNLPKAEFLEQGNLDQTCTRPVLLEGACPKSTIYGTAKAWTPLLDHPLQGPVHLVGGFGYKLPALVADLNGQVRILLVGKIDTGPNGGLRSTFEAVPDAPVSRFVLEMKGGRKYGLLVNSENICAKPQRAVASFTAQNGKAQQYRPLISNSCKGKKKRGKHAS